MTEVTIPRAWIDGDACHVPGFAVHELIRFQARRNPDAIAIEQWDQLLTYQQFTDAAQALADRLRAAGAGPGSRIAICVRRTPWLPVSEVAVLMAGCAFVPLDPDHPAHRLRAIAQDAGAEIVLADTASESLLRGFAGQVINVEMPADGDRMGVSDAPEPVSLDDVAYIMYTSGSTGRPKGVMISHRNLTAFVTAVNQHLGDEIYQLAAFAAVGFDVSVFEFFAPLTCGSSIQLVAEAERADAELLQRFLETHKSSHAFLAPAVLPLLDPDRLTSLRAVMVGGEACDPRQVGRWAIPGVRRFYNWYGPTEATVAVVGTELSGSWDKPLPIGRPLPGCSVYVLDEDFAVCPPGVAGELFAGGPQVGLGYVANPQETAERFVPDPYDDDQGPEAREPRKLYRTGDLAQWDNSGQIWFLGRADRQLKINGIRVEPGEIEAVLSGHPAITQAVVDVSGATVRAFVTPLEAPSGDELREYCTARLPRHMVPASVTVLPRIPLTVNAKTDYAALRQLSEDQRAGLDAASQPAGEAGRAGEAGQVVTRCWAEVFEVTPPGLDDDFFQAGGDSLSAMRLVAALRRATGREFSVQDVFIGRTVGGIAARLGSVGADGAQRQVIGRTRATLSPPLIGLWLSLLRAEDESAYVETICMRLQAGTDLGRLTQALTEAARRHPAFGGSLVDTRDLPEFVLGTRDIAAELVQAPTAERAVGTSRQAVAGLATPMFQAQVVQTPAEGNFLVLAWHHLVIDDASVQVYLDDVSCWYADPATLPAPPALTFCDHIEAVTERDARPAAADSARLIASELDPLLTGQAGQATAGSYLAATPPVASDLGITSFTLPAQAYRRLRDLWREAQVTQAAGWIASYAHAIRQNRDAGHVLIGVPRSLRLTPDDHRIAGYCADTALIAPLVGDADLASTARDVMRWLGVWLAPGSPSLTRVMRELKEKGHRRLELPAIMFNLNIEPMLALAGQQCDVLDVARDLPKFPLSLMVEECGDGSARVRLLVSQDGGRVAGPNPGRVLHRLRGTVDVAAAGCPWSLG